jgi:hypothetical protein
MAGQILSAMITLVFLILLVTLLSAVGALVFCDVYRQTAGWPDHRWTDADDARVARLLDVG